MGNYRKDKITLSYNKAQKDFVVAYPRKADGNLVMSHIINNILAFSLEKQSKHEFYAFNTFNLKEELENRGYDITTLKFSIELKHE